MRQNIKARIIAALLQVVAIKYSDEYSVINCDLAPISDLINNVTS